MLIAAAAALAETGPGSPSVDDALGIEMHGPKWAALSLVLGALGAIGAKAVADAAPEPQPEPRPGQPRAGTHGRTPPRPPERAASEVLSGRLRAGRSLITGAGRPVSQNLVDGHVAGEKARPRRP